MSLGIGIFDEEYGTLRSALVEPPPFPPDDLSRRVPDLAPVTSDDLANIATVWAHYFDHAPREVRRIVTQAHLNTSFLVDDHVLKSRRGAGARHAIGREHALLSTLAARGVRVPKLAVTRTGAPFVEERGAAWLITARVRGEHFVGDGRQLEAIAAELGALVRALRGMTLDDVTPGDFLRVLPDLVHEVEIGVASPLQALVRAHAGTLRAVLAAIVSERAAIETPSGLVHVDLHPMNVLLDGDEVACVLDMEDVTTYPLVPALGFAGYKLVRRAASEPAIGAAGGRGLATRWTAACEQAFPELALDARALGMGARYRELALVTYILRAHVEERAFADGVEASKHLRAFTELDWLFPMIERPR